MMKEVDYEINDRFNDMYSTKDFSPYAQDSLLVRIEVGTWDWIDDRVLFGAWKEIFKHIPVSIQ